MGIIEIDGDDFEIERLSKDNYSPSFVLHIEVENLNDLDFPEWERRKVLGISQRSKITDKFLADEVEKWIESHPSANVTAFGVIEELHCRTGDKL